MEIVLASASPRRKEILSKITKDFKVYPSNFDESSIPINNNPKEYCRDLAIYKAQDISNKFPIGVDTTCNPVSILILSDLLFKDIVVTN